MGGEVTPIHSNNNFLHKKIKALQTSWSEIWAGVKARTKVPPNLKIYILELKISTCWQMTECNVFHVHFKH